MYLPRYIFFFFFFNDTATTEIYTLSLHDALPIYPDLPEDVRGERTPAALASGRVRRLLHPGPSVEGKRHGPAGPAARPRHLPVAAARPAHSDREDPLRPPWGRRRGSYLLRPECQRVHHPAPALPVDRTNRDDVLQPLVLRLEDRRAGRPRAPVRAPSARESAGLALSRSRDRGDHDHRRAGHTETALARRADGVGVLCHPSWPGHRTRPLGTPADARPV